MAYNIDGSLIDLKDLRQRIEETDLVPSRSLLMNGIAEKFSALEKEDISSLSELRNEVKNPKKIEALSKKSGIDAEYLMLLRREIESYFAKPIRLNEFGWVPEDTLEKLQNAGMNDTADLYEATSDPERIHPLAARIGVDSEILKELARLADLTRVQWVNSTVAMALVECGYKSPEELAAADADQLFADFVRVNGSGKYFKHMIGLRDVKRLVKAALYV